MKKRVASVLLMVLLLSGCMSSPDHGTPASPTLKPTTEEPGAVKQIPATSYFSYEGNWEDGKGFGFQLKFLDGQTGTKALLYMSAAYRSGNRRVIAIPLIVTFSDDGNASFQYRNSRLGEGTGLIHFHDQIATITITHTKDSMDGWDFPTGTFDLKQQVPIFTEEEKTVLAADKKVIEEKAHIPASPGSGSGNYYPVSETPDVSIGVKSSGTNLYAWSVVPGGYGDGSSQQVYFFLGDQYLGTDTSQPHGRVLEMWGGDERGTDAAFIFVAYVKSEPPLDPLKKFNVIYSWDGKKLVPDEGYKNFEK